MTKKSQNIDASGKPRQLAMDFGESAQCPGKPPKPKTTAIRPVLGKYCWRIHPGHPGGGVLYRLPVRSAGWYDLFVPPSYLR